uniref:Endonuclease/exonuclease/phosphatase domain-containing protein n=1 Tax=Timema monikensis TaxID=170555 RepID=A0A7R9HS09_9NEOP|nr:unnamed protein product [Timema monikensis]
MDKLAELGRAQQKQHQTQDWARNLEDEDINVELSDNEEESEFTDASILKRKLLFKPKVDKPPKSVTVANQYEILTVREDEPMETIELPSENARQDTPNSQKSKPRIPPIVVAGTSNYSKISKTMKTTMTGTFKIFYIKDGLKIHTSTLDDFKTLQAYLKQAGQEYHTFTLPRDKPLKLVIKGLPPNMPTDEIKDELHTMGYTATDIRQFTSKTQTDNATQDINQPPTSTLVQMTINPQNIIKNQLRILIWNANGILHQKHEFEELLGTYGVDLALICETHLKTDQRFNITGHNIYRTDREHRKGGGTAVIIKDYLPHYRANINDTENLEATTISISTKTGHINFVAAYNPPTKILLKQDLDNITSSDNYFIGGDLNSKNTLWNSRITNRNGRILEDHSTEAEYNIIAPDTPTHYPGNHLHRPDILDIVLTNLKIMPDTLTVLQELDSDHNPLLCEWEVNLQHQTNWRYPTISTTDWIKYKTDLQEALPRNLDIHTEQDIDTAIDLFTTTLQETYKLNTTISRKHHDFRVDHPELSYLLAQKKEARRDWQRLRSPNERIRYNRLKAIVKRTVNQIRRTNFNTFVTDSATNMQGTWTITKVLKGTSKKTNTPAIHGQQGMAYSSLDKANAIALTLEDQFKPNPAHDQNFNRDWRIKVNATKSIAMVVARKRQMPPANFTIYEEDIPFKDDAKYLGIYIDKRLTWTKHITETCKKAMAEMRNNFYEKAGNHDNPIVRALGDYDPHEQRSYKRPRLE